MSDHFRLCRLITRSETTVGILFTSHGQPLCYTLEDGPSPDPHGKKVYARTRIPAGVYPLKAVRSGDIYDAHRRRWKHGFAVGIEDVPGYTHIRIHCGNRATDTKGCPLVGDGVLYAFGDGPRGEAPMLSASRAAYKRIYEMDGGLRYIVKHATTPHIVICDEGEWGDHRDAREELNRMKGEASRAERSLKVAATEATKVDGPPDNKTLGNIYDAMRALRRARGDLNA